jgi:hypothetical protein
MSVCVSHSRYLELDALLPQPRHPQDLVLVEVAHLLGGEGAVPVQVAAAEPVAERVGVFVFMSMSGCMSGVSGYMSGYR